MQPFIFLLKHFYALGRVFISKIQKFEDFLNYFRFIQTREFVAIWPYVKGKIERI